MKIELTGIKAVVKTAAAKAAPAAKWLRKNEPRVWLVVGSVTTVVGVVDICNATLKVDEVLEERKNAMRELDEAVEDVRLDPEAVYTDENYASDKAILQAQGAVKVVRLYARPVGLIMGGFAMIFRSHSLMETRLSTMTTLYNLLERSYSEYRNRVIEDQGEDADAAYRFGRIDRGVDPETGEELWRPEYPDGYSRWWSKETAPYCFTGSKERNYDTLRLRYSYLEDKYQQKGVLYLDEVIKEFGLQYDDLVPEHVARSLCIVKGACAPHLNLGIDAAYNRRATSGRYGDNAFDDGDVLLDFSQFGFYAPLLDFGRRG